MRNEVVCQVHTISRWWSQAWNPSAVSGELDRTSPSWFGGLTFHHPFAGPLPQEPVPDEENARPRGWLWGAPQGLHSILLDCSRAAVTRTRLVGMHRQCREGAPCSVTLQCLGLGQGAGWDRTTHSTDPEPSKEPLLTRMEGQGGGH